MADSDSRPNIILIMGDQHRGDCLSIDGHPVVQTPNLDFLAASGARFTSAYSACPTCIPARRCLMSGMSAAHNGMVGYLDNQPWDPPATLPDELRKAGYHTAFIGRTMHLFPRWKRFGFEYFQPSVNLAMGDEAPSLYELQIERETPASAGGSHGHGIDINGRLARPWHLDESLHETHWTTSQAIHFLQRRDPSQPFFLVVSYFAPHPPLIPPAHYLERYLRLQLPSPAIGDWATPPANGGLGLSPSSEFMAVTGPALQQCQAGYFGLINQIDDQLSRLWQRRCGSPVNLSNTLFLYTSDHGEMLGDHYLSHKSWPYQGSVRIPMIMHGPGIDSGIVCDAPVCLEDIMPTLLDLAGCPIPESVDGRSLAPVLRGEPNAKVRDFLHGEHATCYNEQQANHYLTDGCWKYIWLTHDGTEQLFNLRADPRELHNLAQAPDYATTLATWRGRLIDRLKDRPEGFTDGQQLIPGRRHEALLHRGA